MGRNATTVRWLVLFASLPWPALAQPTGADLALAEVLYRQGRQLIAEGKAAEACPKFAESYRLDAATGTLLNLASCHESEGKLATAWLEFVEAQSLARRDQRDDRARFAQERLARIEPKLSRLTVVVSASSDIEGLVLTLDGVAVQSPARGVPTPVDPGMHIVAASAPGRKAWFQKVNIEGAAQNVTVSIPLLDPEAPVALSVPTSVPPPSPALPPIMADQPTTPIPWPVYAAGGATVAFAIGATATGVVYKNHYDDPERSQGEVKTLGVVNLALTMGAVAGAGLTTYLFFTRPSAKRAAPALTVAPIVADSVGGLVCRGAF
ncbi:MAG TPA: hypothetical protein VJT73_20340 [Polyangiaceae bacterium]|nr:hypothetical protein [Polyangiaceae bacterium]